MDEYIPRHEAIRAAQLAYGDYEATRKALYEIPTADVAPVRHGRCPVCSGREVLAQDCDNGYSVEVDAESGEMTVWNGDTCLAAISIDYCPACGKRMDGAE